MLARDFVDEQQYVVEKLRHHNQMLHGFGVVCGLKVVQHPKEACRDRFVCVEPGTAVDCCGHDIVVRDKDCVDLSTIPELAKLKDANDDKPHTLRICIKYRECESEPIPVLLRRMRLRRRHVRSESHPRVVRDPRAARPAQGPRARTVPRALRRPVAEQPRRLPALRPARLPRPRHHQGLASRYADRRCDDRQHHAHDPAVGAAREGSDRLHPEPGPRRRRRRPGGTRGQRDRFRDGRHRRARLVRRRPRCSRTRRRSASARCIS